MKVNFAKDAWSMDELTHAYTYRFPQTPVFHQKNDCIENAADPAGCGGYDYVSLVSRKKYSPNVKISTRCAFEGDGAPLIVLAKDLYDDDGVLHYGDYLEVVIWKNGLNVWNLWMQEDGTVKWHKLLGIDMPLKPYDIHELSVEIKENRFEINLNGTKISLLSNDIYPSFHLGITGCEGINRFYDMEITKGTLP